MHDVRRYQIHLRGAEFFEAENPKRTLLDKILMRPEEAPKDPRETRGFILQGFKKDRFEEEPIMITVLESEVEEAFSGMFSGDFFHIRNQVEIGVRRSEDPVDFDGWKWGIVRTLQRLENESLEKEMTRQYPGRGFCIGAGFVEIF